MSVIPRMCCKTRVLLTARPDLSIAEPVVFSTVRLAALSTDRLGRPTSHR